MAQVFGGFLPFKEIKAVTASRVVEAAENGTLFEVTGGSGVTFTLPAKAANLIYYFVNTVDQNMTVESAGSLDDIIAMHDAAADSIAFSTSSQKIGAVLCVFANHDASKWIAMNLSAGANTATAA